jgi:allophanate hydrolase subunit 1
MFATAKTPHRGRSPQPASEKPQQVRERRLVVVLDKSDAKDMERIAKHEKLSKSDCVRRLIRDRARQLPTRVG